MRLQLLASTLVLAAAGFATHAVSADKVDGRYKMSPVEDGFVRLDTQTGEMSLCTRKGSGWSCEPMAGDGRGGGDELARLREENSQLRDENRRMEETFGLDAGGSNKAAPRDGDGRDGDDFATEPRPEIQLPDEEQVDKAIDYLEGMIRKFRERFEEFGDKTAPRRNDDRGDKPAGEETTPL